MSTDKYIATVYGRGGQTKAFASIREALAWIKDRVGGASYRQSGIIRRGDTRLCTYTPTATEWHADGFARWRNETEAHHHGL